VNVVLLLSLMSAACTSTAPSGSSRDRGVSGPCALSADQVRRIRHGYFAGASGDVQIVPAAPHYFSANRTHAGPWDYLQEVPLLFYGPGHITATGSVGGHATVADIAPTLAEHLGFTFRASDGRALDPALPGPGTAPPRLVVVVVWDGGGRNVLARYPHAWPNLSRLIEGGVWFQRATIDTSPSVTAPVHATIGTGAYPSIHGRVGNQVFARPETPGEDPRGLLVPTLADAWDRANGNAAVVGMAGLRTWHLGMMGDGAYAEGGDRDPAVLLDEETATWGLPPAFRTPYRFPPYAASTPGLERELTLLDQQDGEQDRAWMGEPVLDDPLNVIATPAFTHWQSRLLERLIPREAFGADDLADLLFVNVKQIDLVGHRWSMDSPQARAVVQASDEALGAMVGMLDRFVGEGEWVLALTADHGSTPPARVSGGWVIDQGRFLTDIRRRFDRDGDDRSIVASASATQLWLDGGELAQEGIGAGDVAAFVAAYTIGQNARDPSGLPAGRGSVRLFQAAFPSTVLEAAACGR
jgi:hypothetical protein